MLLTSRDIEQRAAYEAAKPKQGGDLHERMKWLVTLFDGEVSFECPYLRDALYDLETEVSFYAPADPPFAARTRHKSKTG